MTACPNEESFARFVEGELPTAARDVVAVHIDDCPQCRVLVAEMTRADVPGAPAEPMPQRIGRFELRSRLGEGAMGVVYLARDPTLRRDVAIKLVHPRRALHAKDTGGLMSEAQAAARLNHANAVTVHEVGRHGDQVFVVMEYVPGATLRELIDKGLHWRRAIELLVAAGRGLQAAHEAGLVHRDFKPDNVIVGQDGRARVTDFGLARVGEHLAKDASLRLGAITSNTTGAGTPIYMAAEQLLHEGSSALSDQYAFAVTCFLALYGRLPHFADSLVELTHLVISEPVPAPPPDSPVPAAVHPVLARALSVESGDRFSSLAELLERLILAAGGSDAAADEERESPFLGLLAFSPSDARRYHGRDNELERARRLVAERGLVAVLGPSGVGKSSFVGAGLYPSLDATDSWQLVSLRPGGNPMVRLAEKLASVVGSPEPPTALAHRLARDPNRLPLELEQFATTRRVRVLLFVDQFEELYTLAANPAERDAFARCIAAVAQTRGPAVRAVIALRSDFVDRVADQRILLDPLAGAFLFLPAPDRAMLADALQKPIERFGYAFDSTALVDELIAGLAESAAALPLLQFVAARMWAARDREARRLTRASYEQLGAVAGALSAHADAVVVGFSPAQRALIRRLFLRLVTPARTRDVASVSDLCSLAPDDEASMASIIDRLADERLLVVREGDSGESMVELVHESLIRSWPMLAGWLAASQAHAVRLGELREAARQWDRNERSAGLLWGGEMAHEARVVARHLGDQLGDTEREFVRAIASHERRRRRRRRTGVIAAMVALAVIAALAIGAVAWIGQAEQRAVEQASVADAEAERARAAERQTAAQLELVRAEKRQREAAEAAATSAQSDRELSQAKLAERNRQLQHALAETATAKERLSAANRELERTNRELAQKLADERRRHRERERRLKELADDKLEPATKRKSNRLRRDAGAD